MQEVLLIFTAVLFYLLGKYSQSRVEQELLTKFTKHIKHTPKAGVLPFKTPEEREADRSGETALAKEWEKLKL